MRRRWRAWSTASGSFFHFSSARARDFSIELDPRSVRDGDIAAYAAMGFNRASFGVQDFDRAVQLAINREQTVEETLRAIDACRTSGFRSVNVDLIYGLPRQTLARISAHAEHDRAGSDRIAWRCTATRTCLRMFKAQRQIDESELPDAAERFGAAAARDRAADARGLQLHRPRSFRIARRRSQCRAGGGQPAAQFHGLHHARANRDLIGLGASSISHVGDSYSQNSRDLPAWESAVDQGRLPIARGLTLDDDDVMRGAGHPAAHVPRRHRPRADRSPLRDRLRLRTLPSRWRELCRWRRMGWSRSMVSLHRCDLARPPDAAYHRDVLRPLSCDTVRFRNRSHAIHARLIAPAALAARA